MSVERQDDLEATVRERAQADEKLSDEAKLLVLAAMQGDDTLTGALEAGVPAAPPAGGQPQTPVRAFLSSIIVEGLRGIGPKAEQHAREADRFALGGRC